MRIVNTLYPEAYQSGLVWQAFPATAGERFVDGTVFVAAQFHGPSLLVLRHVDDDLD